MVEEAERRGDLRPGMTVVEYTGGSTGSSLAYVCAAKGYRFRVVSSDASAEEKLKTMQAFRADLTVVPSFGGEVTPDLVPRMIDQASKYAAEPDTFWTDQLNNADLITGYRGIGVELLAQMDRPIDVFCAAVGTAGLAMGVSAALAEGGSPAKIVIFEPASSPVITEGKAGTHHVEGIGVLPAGRYVGVVRPEDSHCSRIPPGTGETLIRATPVRDAGDHPPAGLC